MATLSVIYKIAADITNLQQNVSRGAQTLDQLDRKASVMAAGMQSMGRAVAGAFTVGAMVSFGRELIATADNLKRLSDRTDISVEGLQRFQRVGDEAGNSLEDITTAVERLQKQLGEGKSGTIRAVEQLGLSFADLKLLAPEDQFMEIAEALSEIEDPLVRMQIGVALFGRGFATILPTIKQGFDDAKNASVGMSTTTVNVLDQIGDSLVRLTRDTKAYAGSVVASIIVLNDWVGLVDKMNQRLNLAAATKRAPTGVIGASLGMPDMSESEIRRVAQESEEHLRRLERATVDAAEAAVKAGAAYRTFWNFIGERTREADAALVALRNMKEIVPLVGGLIAEVPFNHLELMGRNLQQMGSDQFGGGFGGGLASGVRSALEQTKNWKDTLSEVVDVLNVLGDRWASLAVGILRNSQAIVALWGTNKGAAIGMAIGAAGQFIPTSTTAGKVGFGAAQGAATGAAFGSIIPGLGTVVGGAIGAGIGAIVGWIQSQKAHKQVNDLRDAFIEAAGGLGALDRKAHDAGMTLTRILDAKTPQEYQRAIEELNAAFAFQDASVQALNDAIERYGLSIEELGPALSQQKLDEQVMQLITDFRLLEGAGVDVETISLHMADAINEYVQNAMRAGATIPEAMREILQQLVTMGLLYDQNGNLITDLEQSGITFAETLDEKFGTLIDTINRMVDAIARFLGITEDAADQVANFPDFPDNAGPGLPDTPRLPDLDARSGGGVIEIHTHTDLDGREIARVVTHVQNDDMSFRNQLRAA